MPEHQWLSTLSLVGTGVVLSILWIWKQQQAKCRKKHEVKNRYEVVVASTDEELLELRRRKWEPYSKYEPRHLIARLNGCEVLLRAGLTLTPYANATSCSAKCSFCSQELARTSSDECEHHAGSHHDTSDYLPRPLDYEAYFDGLTAFFRDLRSSRVQVGLSLSGLEVSSEPVFFHGLMRVINEYRDIFDELVVYTNGSGFVSDDMVLALKSACFDRVELSRHHFDATKNQKIMRFERNWSVRHDSVYQDVVRKLLSATRCVLHTCLLNSTGCNSIEDVEHYVIWSRELGICNILFQELSQLDPTIHADNSVSRYIENHRVCIESLLEIVAPTLHHARRGWQYKYSRVGYYYYYETYSFEGSEITFGVPSYEMFYSPSRLQQNVVDKLIFWGDLSVTADWDHRVRQVAHYGDSRKACKELF